MPAWTRPPELGDAVDLVVHEFEGETQSAEYVFLGTIARFLSPGGRTMMMELSQPTNVACEI